MVAMARAEAVGNGIQELLLHVNAGAKALGHPPGPFQGISRELEQKWSGWDTTSASMGLA